MKKDYNKYVDALVKKIINETIEDKAEELVSKLTEGDKMVCSECGVGNMYEGECSECGYRMESEFSEGESFDYVEEDLDPLNYTERYCDEESEDYDESRCKYFQDNFKKGEVSEKYSKGQQYIAKQAKPTNKITADDFKKLRSMKKETDEEVEEGNAFTGALAKAKKEGDKSFEVDGKKFNVKESIQMTESEMIEFIEKIVLQEEEKLKSMGKTKGLNVYQKAHTASGKENKEYLQSVVKKMKDYLKDGSKGDYDMNPEIFPKGNGELTKMDKKAYTPSDAVKDYTDNLTLSGD